MRDIRYAHISLLPTCSVGIVNKLDGCAQDAIERGLPVDYLIIAPRNSAPSFEGFDAVKVLFVDADSRLAIRFAQFRVLKGLLMHYTGVVLRYPGADLGPLVLGCRLGNCIAEHHTLFIQEQSQSSLIRANIERFLGAIWLSCFYGHIAVTDQILDDVLSRARFAKTFGIKRVLPNPYKFSSFYREGSFKKKETYTGVVSASSFMLWHGLDRIINMFRAYDGGRFKLLVVGDSTAVTATISNLDALSVVEFISRKTKIELSDIYNGCDFAFNSFGLDRLDMSVGSTLKLREYFDFSLPVISPMRDSGLPLNFDFLYTENMSLNSIADYLDGLDGVPLADIKQCAQKYLGVEAFNDAIGSLWDRVEL